MRHTSPGDRQEVFDMATKRRRLRWDNAERVVRLLISIADEVAKLMNALHGVH